MARAATILILTLATLSCSKSGGDSSVVSCPKLNRRLTECTAELGFSQTMLQATGRSAAEVLAEVMVGRIGTDCPVKNGKLDDAPAINDCLGKPTCAEMAACFDGLAR